MLGTVLHFRAVRDTGELTMEGLRKVVARGSVSAGCRGASRVVPGRSRGRDAGISSRHQYQILMAVNSLDVFEFC